jgi:hypothetical protein
MTLDTTPLDSTTCPAMPDPNTRHQDAAKLLQAMGASQECKTKALASLSEQSSAGSVYAQGSVGFASAKAGASFSEGSSNTNTASDSDGCASVYSQLNQQLISHQNMTCSISAQSDNVSTITSSNNSIVLTQLQAATPDPAVAMMPAPGPVTNTNKAGQGLTWDSSKTQMKNMMPPPQMPTYPKNEDAFTKEMFDKLVTAYQANFHEYMQFQEDMEDTVTLNDVEVTMSSTTNVKTHTQLSQSTVTKLQSQVKDAVTSSAAAKIQETTGLGAAVMPGVKQALTQFVSQKTDDVTAMIQHSALKTTLTNGQNNTFELKFYGALHMSHTNFDQHISARLTADTLMKSSRTLGKSIGTSIMTDIATKSDAEIEQKGLSDVVAALGKARAEQMDAVGNANANAIKAGGLGGGALLMLVMLTMGGGSKILIYIVLAIIAYIVLAFFMSIFPFSKPSKRRNFSGTSAAPKKELKQQIQYKPERKEHTEHKEHKEHKQHKEHKEHKQHKEHKKDAGYRSNVKYIS